MNTFSPNESNKISGITYKTSINGLFYINRPIYADKRGFFSETLIVPDLENELGKSFQIKQINQARSDKNVVRGIHAEGWNKYISISQGRCFSAIVDVRPDSSTFGEKEVFILGFGEEALTGCLFIPSGVGNSVCVLDGPLDYWYFVDAAYRDRDKSGDTAINLFDPDIAISWPIRREEMILSERDLQAVSLRSKYPDKF